MSMRVNGEVIESSFEIWAVKRTSSDNEVVEIAFECEEDARLDQSFYGGTLWVRTCYATEGHEVTENRVEDLRV